MKYMIVEFINTKTVAVIPSNWICQNEVKWNEIYSPSYSKKGLFPKNKWNTFKVKQLTSIDFDTYRQAETSMNKILNLNKTNIETDDIESGGEIQKRGRDSSSSDEDTENPLKCIKPIENENLSGYSNLTQGKIGNVMHAEHFPNGYEEEIVVETDDIQSEVILVRQNTLDEILIKINNLEESMKRIENLIETNKNCENCSRSKFVQEQSRSRCSDILPLKHVEGLIEFDEKLSEDSTLISDFQNYLVKRISIRDLRSFTRSIITKSYAMDVQGQINYTGVKNKAGLKGLVSTDAILRTMCKYVPELIVLEDENEQMGKAEAEFKYQLQHFYDRKRSLDRKNASRSKNVL